MLELRVRVEALAPPEAKVTLVGFRDVLRPAGDAVEASETVPAKPLELASVIDAVVDTPATTVTLDGAEIVKSTTFTATVTERETEPLVACIATI